MTPSGRVAEVRKLLKKRGCTSILVSDPIDVEYISGFRATNAYLLISRSSGTLLTDFRYWSASERFCHKRRTWRNARMTEDGFSALNRHIRRGSRVGVQSDSLTVDQFDRLRKQCRAASFVKLRGALKPILAVKLPREIASIQRAARAGDMALAAFVKRLRPGMSESAAAGMLDDACREHGSEGPSFPTIVLFGERSALPHGHPSSRKLKRRDWVLCDFGCTCDGLCSDMTRTLVMGPATASQRSFYDVVYRAQAAARKIPGAGVRAADVDRTARRIIRDAGYGEAFGHATGHGVGRRIHEGPRLGRRDPTILREGMVVTVEPGIYVPEVGGVRIEDMVVVGARGSRCLTRFPRELIEIGR